jgi:hypothetical protein
VDANVDVDSQYIVISTLWTLKTPVLRRHTSTSQAILVNLHFTTKKVKYLRYNCGLLRCFEESPDLPGDLLRSKQIFCAASTLLVSAGHCIVGIEDS